MTPAHRPTSPSLASVREFLRLQAEAPRRSLLSRLFGIDPLAKSAAHAYAGAVAEVEVAQLLDRLGHDWTVLDTVQVDAHEPPVEHVVIGPPGVFSIALRNHAGERVWVGERTFIADGTRFPHLRDAEHESDMVAARLSAASGGAVTVTPCLVLAAPAELSLRDIARPVEVFTPARLTDWLIDLPRVLSPRVVAGYSAIALTADTWHHSPSGWDALTAFDASSDRAKFEAFRREIARARRLRVGWLLLGIAL
ncbi:MAG: NERD domain-containing protein [Actinomycetota bacterium]